MARILSGILTALTVLVLAALALALGLDPLIDAELHPLTTPLGWTLGVLVVMRLLLNIRHLRSKAAAPLLDSAAAQSRFYGFPPGTSRIDDPGVAAEHRPSALPDD